MSKERVTGKCERCGASPGITTMSYFNYDEICRECREKERDHPKFNEAYEAEVAAVKGGDLNFEGIGKPEDL